MMTQSVWTAVLQMCSRSHVQISFVAFLDGGHLIQRQDRSERDLSVHVQINQRENYKPAANKEKNGEK